MLSGRSTARSGAKGDIVEVRTKTSSASSFFCHHSNHHSDQEGREVILTDVVTISEVAIAETCTKGLEGGRGHELSFSC
jgi:hypothetical protein